MKEIGGYFELELNKGNEYHDSLLSLNTGRNCLEYILQVRNYKKIYIPYYTCEVVLEPIEKLNIEYIYYNIDENLNIEFNEYLAKNEALLVNNYFGIKDKRIKKYAERFKNLIVDNSQAFFSKPLVNIDTFYSPRKFFGVADGGYLSIDKKLDIDFEQDISYDKMSHLHKRIDVSANYGYEDFKKNDEILNNQPIKFMSKLTKKILASLDYNNIAKIRRENFVLLHKKLNKVNLLNFQLEEITIPMFYPLLVDNGKDIKQRLIESRIFVPTYWPNVFKCCEQDSVELNLAKNLIPLPIDQRYGAVEIKRILQWIKLLMC